MICLFHQSQIVLQFLLMSGLKKDNCVNIYNNNKYFFHLPNEANKQNKLVRICFPLHQLISSWLLSGTNYQRLNYH
jgi:hypothetical protein